MLNPSAKYGAEIPYGKVCLAVWAGCARVFVCMDIFMSLVLYFPPLTFSASAKFILVQKPRMFIKGYVYIHGQNWKINAVLKGLAFILLSFHSAHS